MKLDKVDQISLFNYPKEQVFSQLSVTPEFVEDLFVKNFLSYNPNSKAELIESEYAELSFCVALFSSGLSQASIEYLLSKLSQPYSFDIRKIYFNFLTKDWELFPEEKQSYVPDIEDLLDEIITYDDIETLEKAQEKIAVQIDALNAKKFDALKIIADYQHRCWSSYKKVIGIDDLYSYLYGNPVKVQIPIDVGCNNLMIIGAYPTAHFANIHGFRDVPIEDHLYPFSNDVYFDGTTTRYVNSGLELEELYLRPLQLERKNCWITDLVKIFLFKEGHIVKYKRLGDSAQRPKRDDFIRLAKLSLGFIEEEISICKPKIILLLGEEVTSIVLKLSKKECLAYLNKPEIKTLTICGSEFKFIGAPHPGVLMREERNSGKWNNVVRKLTIPLIKNVLYH